MQQNRHSNVSIEWELELQELSTAIKKSRLLQQWIWARHPKKVKRFQLWAPLSDVGHPYWVNVLFKPGWTSPPTEGRQSGSSGCHWPSGPQVSCWAPVRRKPLEQAKVTESLTLYTEPVSLSFTLLATEGAGQVTSAGTTCGSPPSRMMTFQMLLWFCFIHSCIYNFI